MTSGALRSTLAAGSPQAKGRIERLWGTCQDRLVVELRLAEISDRDAANAFLTPWLARHKRRVHRPGGGSGAGLGEPCRPMSVSSGCSSCKYRRKVAHDHTITLGGRVLALPRVGRTGYVGRMVEVHLRLDGSIVVFDGERELAVALAPLDPVQLRAAHGRRADPGIQPAPATLAWVPPAQHPWRRVRRDTALYQTRLTESLTR